MGKETLAIIGIVLLAIIIKVIAVRLGLPIMPMPNPLPF